LDNKVFDVTDARCNHEDCVLIFSTTFVWKASRSKKNSGIYHNCTTSSCKVPIILVIS